jgi:hypothetical protein
MNENVNTLTTIIPLPKIKKLRRTLTDRPQLARFVKEIYVPGAQQLYQRSSAQDRQLLISNLASLVMCCPSLERFSGLHMNFDHEYDRLTHALSTRSELKEKVWIFKGIENGYDGEGNYRTNARSVRGDGSIDNGDVFLRYHDRWKLLETLMLFGQDTGNLDYRAFVGTFRTLRSLKHLVIAGFNSSQFNDRTMAALPQGLLSLRLQDLPGVTEKGLFRFIDSAVVISLQSLSLINLELKSARHLSRLFSYTPFLKRFIFVQSSSPTTDPSRPLPNPIYQSASLEFLHWDVTPFSNPSLGHLVDSIKHNAFPSLRTLRCPCDDGSLQALCRPCAQIARPNDADGTSTLSLRSNLGAARMAAQQRLEMAREDPLMRVIVTDEDGLLLNNYIIRNYMGDVRSKITYLLEAEAEDSPESSGLLECDHLFAKPPDWARDDIGVRKMPKASTCQGAAENGWVGTKGGFQVKHGKGHVARERVKPITWQMFF